MILFIGNIFFVDDRYKVLSFIAVTDLREREEWAYRIRGWIEKNEQ